MLGYYVLILISVIMFGGGFALQDAYRKMRGSSLKISMESTCIGALAGLVVLLIIDGFAFELTPFTAVMAILTAINAMALTFCTFKGLDYINLSLFSVFAMLGGMVLPFFQGIIFYGEGFSLAKGVCLLFICISLAFTIERGEKKKGTIFYVGIFVLNGLSGVFSKIYAESELPKASSAGYSVWMALATVILSGAIWFVLSQLDRKKAISEGDVPEKTDNKTLTLSYGAGAAFGVVNKVANFFLLVALLRVDTSVLSPLVTGGTMIVSTAISYFEGKKPTRNQVISVALSFVGMIALFAIPI